MLFFPWWRQIFPPGAASASPPALTGPWSGSRHGHLRVGVFAKAPWTGTRGGAEPAGIEPDLGRRFAATLPARIQWFEGGEQKLVDELERGETHKHVMATLPVENAFLPSLAPPVAASILRDGVKNMGAAITDRMDTRDACTGLDWKIQDIVLVPVASLPQEVGGGTRDHQSERNR